MVLNLKKALLIKTIECTTISLGFVNEKELKTFQISKHI